MSTAVVQICEHDKMVAVHLIATANGQIRDDRESIAEVLFGFFGLTWDDWVANRWRLEIRTSEEVRVMPICELHTVPASTNKEKETP